MKKGFRQNKRINPLFSMRIFRRGLGWRVVVRINRRNNKQRWMWRGINLPVGQERSKYVVSSHKRAVRRLLTASLTAVIAVKQAAFIIVRTFPRDPDVCTRFRFPFWFRAGRRHHGAAHTRLKTNHLSSVVVFVVPVILLVERTMANMEWYRRFYVYRPDAYASVLRNSERFVLMCALVCWKMIRIHKLILYRYSIDWQWFTRIYVFSCFVYLKVYLSLIVNIWYYCQ